MLLSEAFNMFITDRVEYLNLTAKTKTNYRYVCNSFIKSNGDIELESIEFKHVALWKKAMTDRNLSDVTIEHEIYRFRSVVKYFTELGYPVLSPKLIPIPKGKRKKPKYLRADDVGRLMDACYSLKEKTLIALLFSTGCRISELMNLDKTDIGPEVIVLGKGHKYRTVFIDEATLSLCKAYLAFRSDDLPYLFVGHAKKRMGVSAAQKILENAAKKLGTHVHPHMLRHSFATDLAHNNVSLRIIQELLGHQNQSTTQMYTHFAVSDLRHKHHEFHTTLTETPAI
jgi:site-specific recombinase XerD